ncbi:MAG: carboxymuconolactone decarboxylase family protein [Deltaproteobacteria bacterium]|nr:carboxymuconolactone decarboxylase family protein [Deltaproteobacteria bacterium]
MTRLPDLQLPELTAEQKRIYDEIAGPRSGSVRGPFPIWLRTPALADLANQLSSALRRDGKLDKRLLELAVLVVARQWSAQYEWFVHERAALNAGLSPEIVEAIRERRAPEFVREDERLVYEVVTELLETRTLSQTSYDRALAALGLEPLIELITTAGFYTMIAMILVAFEAPVPGGNPPLR